MLIQLIGMTMTFFEMDFGLNNMYNNHNKMGYRVCSTFIRLSRCSVWPLKRNEVTV